MAERWQPIDGWPYEVSDMGRVRRTGAGKGTLRGKVLNAAPGANGYPCASLSRDGRVWKTTVHSLVATAFIGPRPLGAEVNHINGNKTDNSVRNLEYVTHRANGEHAMTSGLLRSGAKHPNAKLSVEDVACIRAALTRGERPCDLGRVYSVAESTIRKIRDRARWRAS